MANEFSNNAKTKIIAAEIYNEMPYLKKAKSYIPQEQMVGVGQNHLAAHVIQLFRRESFDGGLSTHRHEHGGFKGAVGRVQTSQAGATAAAFFN